MTAVTSEIPPNNVTSHHDGTEEISLTSKNWTAAGNTDVCHWDAQKDDIEGIYVEDGTAKADRSVTTWIPNPDSPDQKWEQSKQETTEVGHDVQSWDILYTVDDIPPFGVMFSVALQNVLLAIGGALTTAYVISDVICAPSNHPIRAQIFGTTLFMNGICTALQPLIGVRLPIFQGVCSTFLIPLVNMRSEERWRCETLGLNRNDSILNASSLNETSSGITDPEVDQEMYRKLREIAGSLCVASLFEVVVGLTGIVGVFLSIISPLTIATVVSLIGLSLYRIPLSLARTHWGISAMCICLTAIFMLYLDKVQVPFHLGCKKRKGDTTVVRMPVFRMFPLILSIFLTWAFCGILTTVGVFTDDPARLTHRARTDIKNELISNTPWFYVPYPGQFGTPLFNTTICAGFLCAVISSILESIGDYYAAASISGTPPPPRYAVNRGILFEGLGSVLSGVIGAGHATTSSTPNVALIGISKVGSRSCLSLAGVICIILAVISKFGAILSTMPDPIVGGAMYIGFGILASIGVFTLKSVDMTSSRNMTIFGLSVYAGIVVPEWVLAYPESLMFGTETVNGIIKGFIGSPMFLGGFVSIVLDNTVKGTLKERGFTQRDGSVKMTYLVSENTAYALPFMDKILTRIRFLHKLPFIRPAERKDTDDVSVHRL